jgi:ribonuclease-3
MELLGERIREAAAGPGGQDYKTRLQELAARQAEPLPRYTVEEEGPDHAKRFRASVQVGGRLRGQGEGRSKKQAEQAAARMAWADLSGTTDPSPGPTDAQAVGGVQGSIADPAGGGRNGERA